MPSSLESLYNQIKYTGVAGKSYDEFQNKMADAAYRQNLYKSLSKHGAKIGDNIGEFEQKLGYGYVSPSAPTTKEPKSKPTPAFKPQPIEQKATEEPAPVVNQEHELTDADKQAMGMWANDASYNAENATKGIDRIEANAKSQNPWGDGKAGLVFNKNLRVGPKSFNAETGQFEDTYMTTLGESYTNPGEASNMQNAIDEQGQYIRFKENTKKLGIDDITGEGDKTIDQRIKDAYAELENLEVEIDKGRLNQASRIARASGLAGSGALHDEDWTKSKDYDNLLSAKRMLERRIKALEAERADAGFTAGAWNTLTDDSGLSLGLTDVSDYKVLDNIKSKIDKGQPLTNNEKIFARQYLMNQEAQQLNENRSWWYSAGEGFGETLNFMKDFALTGGGFAGIAKQGLRMGTKAGLKYAGSNTAKYLAKNLGVSGKVLNKTIQYGAKYGGMAAGAEVAGTALANTVQLPKTFANIANRSIGTMSVDDDGKLAFKDAEDLGKAVLYEELKASGENASELVGPAFDLIPGIMGRVIRNKVGGSLLKKLTSNKLWRGGEKTLNYLGVQSVFGEGMEEEYGMLRTSILNTITGGEMDPNAPSITDLDNQLNTWATVGLTSVILRAPQMINNGYGAANYYGYKYNLNRSDKQLRSVLGDERYQGVKDILDNADNKNIGNAINSLVSGGQLSNEEKEAVMFYAQDLINLRGYNIGSVLAASQIDHITPRTASYRINGNNVEELDERGNVINTHEYENRDDMKAGLYEMQQQRFDHDLGSDISVMKARPDNQWDKLVNDYLLQSKTELVPSEFEAILAKPSMERTDQEQQMATDFAKLLHNTVYDSTMLHEEQSAQDGATAAEAATLDMDNPDPTELQEANAAFMAASEIRNAAFNKNEELKQEVLNMEGQGLSHQEIISRLETFSPQDQQAVIDYYNQKAKYESAVNKVSNKIDEEAANSRQRHTFKGTINGQADLSNVYTITDGTNLYYLVSGNIATDSEGHITGSDSGLIIGMDIDGSFVNIGDTNGYSVLPTEQSLDQFEEAERIRLQRLWTEAINPQATVQPQEAQAVTEQPVAEQPAEQEPVAEQQPTQIPVDEKSGLKRYEQGIPADQAIQDIENDGFDVNEMADAYIAEAQEQIEKINGKAAKKPQDLIERKRLQDVVTYYNNIKERYAELHPVVVDATPYIAQIKQAQSHKKVDEAYQSAINAGVRPEDIDEAFGNRHAEITAREEEEKRKAEEITDRDLLLIEEYKHTPEGRAWLLDRKRVPSAEKRRKIAALIYGERFDADFDAWRDVRELISSWLSKGRALDPDSFGQELGWDMGIGKDAAKVSTMFTARRENGGDGMLFNDFVHMVMEASNGRYTTEEIRNTLIDMFQQAQEKADLTEYQLMSRIAEAEKDLQNEETHMADLAEQDEELEESQPADTGQLPFAPADQEEPRPAFLDDNGVGTDNQGNPIEAMEQTSIGFEDGKTDNIGSKKPENTTTWQYNFYYDKDTGRVRITRDDVSGPKPIGDGRWHLDAKSLDEMRAILENPANNLGDVYKDVEASLHNAEVGERLRNESNPIKAIEQAANQFRQEQQEKPKSNNKIFTDDAHEEVLKKLRAKFNNLNAGFDPEIALLMLQDAGYHIEKGARKIADCAKAMIDELGDFVRPYIKSAYNAVRDYPGMEEIAKEMSSFEEVQAFDPLNYDKQEDISVNVNKQENNDTENVVNLQSEPNNSNNGYDRDNAPVRAEGQRDGGNGEEQTGGVRQGAQQESKRSDRSGQGSRTEGVGESNLRSSGRLQGLNKNNNHEERGTESAPTSTIGRIEANIEAIELMQKLMEEGRPATDEEKKVLRQFSGWGGLGAAFNNPVYENKLRELLGDAAYEQAQMSRNSAYFTPAKIIDRLWDIAKALGFKGGNVLEGSAGIGKMIGLMPSELSESSNIQAVEIDETTGNILKLLYPDAQVDIQGFEETKIPNGSVDLAITNVPFVTGLHVKDNSGDGDLSKKFGNIHDFCIAKNIRKLKEGGIGIFITSKGTLDDSQNLREWISAEGNADVVGAFRLNNETFGGTPVTSDIIIVRKRVNGNKSANAIDVALPSAVRTAKFDTGKTKKVKNPETGRKEEVRVYRDMPLDYNGYFIEHPEHMGGVMAYNFERDITFQPTSKSCFPVDGKNQDALLNDWVEEMQNKDWSQEQTVETEEAPVNNYEKYGEGVKEGSLILDSKGNVCIARYGQAVPLDTNDKKVKGQTKQQCLKDYNAVKNALQYVLDYQMNNESDKGLKPLLDKLNKAFDQFVNKYGHFHGNTAIAFLRNDVDYASVGALETYSEKTNKDGTKTPIYGKADVFSKRVVEKEKEPQPTTIKDGVIASIYKYGGIDIPYIAKQLGLSEEEAKKQIVDNELGYENPDTMQVDVSYVYLSGNVREKLQKARKNNVNGKYSKNISALEKKVPADIPAHLIEFNLGSTWIENQLYTDFFKEMTDKKVTCKSVNGGWVINIPDGWTSKDEDGAIISEMCDKTIYTSQLIAAAMQGKTIKVQKVETHRDPWGNKTTETITDKEATQACAARIEELKAEFKDWARGKMQADPELSERTEKTYNDRFNNYAPLVIPTDYAPSHFGGMTRSISLREHQSKAVIKGITQPVMYAHGVGAGKTYTLISTAMEMRRIGTAKKPMIVVQNATVGQFTESAKQLYPGAKILTMDDDHSEAARKAFYAKIKYNDWDLIIISQSVLDKIPDNPDRQIAFIRQKIDEKEMVLEQLRANKESGLILKQMENEINDMEDEIADLVDQSRERQEKKRKRDEKKRAVAKQNAAVKAKEQLDRSVDDVDDFDDMDIDAILVDEAHGYKKLGFESVMTRVKGVDTGSSKKCASLFLKTRAVLEKSNGKNVVFATGTPVSNTAAEVWTFMRYLMPADVMKEYGIYYFDDFARNFGNVQQMLEFSTSGKFKENNRFAGYVNMPELARIWASVADTVVVEDAKEVQEKLPQLEGGKATDLYLPQTKALRAIMKKVRYILEQYENMSGKEKKRNSHIPLVAYGIAKSAAVDARLVDANAEDEPNSKTNEAVRQTLRSLEETKNYNGTVAIFADNYQNKHTGFNLYQDIKKKLVEQGVPDNQIAIISGSPKLSDKKKLEIFDKVNKGEIRVVLGSTFTLGTGVNIQERLHTLIHIDAPNRPMDYEQRNGRIKRQGNLHKEWGIPVRILRFGVEDSLDVTAYQRLKTKGAIAESVMKGDRLMKNAMDSRILEEEEDTFGDTVAQLSGSEYAMLKNQAEKEVRKLEAKKKQHEADQIFIHAQLPRLKGQNKEAEERIDQYKKTLAKVEEASKNGTTIEIGEGKYDSLDAMAEFFTNYNSKIREIENNLRKEGKIATQRRELNVKINGFDIKFTTVIDAGSKLEKGRMVPFTTRNVSYSCDELWGNASFTCKGGYIKNGIEDILNDTMTGNDYREDIETAQNTIDRNNQQIKALEERQGRDFTEEEALQKAKDRLEEYTQKMKEEMEAKEAKYREMDAEVEEAVDLDWDNDDEDTDSEEVNKSVILDPIEAMNAAAERWNQDNAIRTDAESNTPDVAEIAKQIYDLPSKYGFKGAAITQVVGSRDELEALKGKINSRAFDAIEESYNDPRTAGLYLPRLKMVVIFSEKLLDANDGEHAWWHEQTHNFWHSLPEELRDKYGSECLEYIKANAPEVYHEIKDNYKISDWKNEACSYLIELMIKKIGTEKFLATDFANNEIIRNFASELKNSIRNGKQQERQSGNRPEQAGSVGREDNASRRSDLRGRDNQQEESGQEEVNRRIVNPLEAIRDTAERWRKKRKESEEEAEAVKEYSAKEVYNQRVDTADFVTTEAYQDAMVGLKTIQNAIAQDKEIPDSQNAYQGENLMHGTNYVEQEQFNTEIRATLLAAINDIIKKTGMSYDDVDRYTITKHGLERNRELFVRDWFNEERKKPATYAMLTEEEQEAYDKLANQIETQFEDGIIDSEEQKEKKLEQALKKVHKDYLDKLEKDYVKLKNDNYGKIKSGDMTFQQYLEAIDNFIKDNIDGKFVAEKHDYSGLTALYGKDYKEADVISTLTDTENNIGKGLTDGLWERINKASQYGIDRYRQAGMRSDELLDKIENMFHWYVPLRGFKENTGEDMYQYFTSKGEDMQHLGGLIKSAKGRKSEAFSPIVSLINMSYKTITDCNQNLVNQKFYRLCQANPNDAVILSDSWVELDKNTGEWVQAYPQIDEEATEDEVVKAMADFEAEMKSKEKDGQAKRLKGKPNFDYRPADKKKQAEHTVEVYINGQRKLMTVVGNPRAAQALNGQTRWRKADNFVSDWNAAAKNWMSKVSTSYNPTFAARNMMRDWTHFEAILLTREGNGYRNAASGYYHPTRMMGLFKKYRNGTLDESIEEERDFKDFMDNGALTGYIHIQKMEELQNDIKKQLDKMQKNGTLKIKTETWFSNMLDAVEAANEAIENAARFATYRASRHYAGRTRARSAYDAKEVTVNFNRKGAGSRTAGFKSKDKSVMRRAKLAGRSAQILSEGRMFFNATLQAVATIFKNFKNPDGSLNWKYIGRFSTRYALPPFAVAALMPALNMALLELAGGGDGDDPYANLPEWVRRKNICIYLGWIPGLENTITGTQISKFMYDNFLTIPIGQELAAFFSLGDLAASLIYAPNLRPVDLDLFNEFVSFINVFSPVDLDTKVTERDGWDRIPFELMARVSTVIAPVVAVEENVSWTGRSIYREDKFEGDDEIPEYQMVYNNTNGGFVFISKMLNDINGDDVERGTVQINPGAMQYLVEQYTGGPGKLATNTGSAVHDVWDWIVNGGDNANFNIRKIEIAKAFIQQADDNTQFYRTKSKYRLYKEKADELNRTIKRYSEDAAVNPDHYARLLQLTKGVDYARMDIIKTYESDMKKLNKAIYASTGKERKLLQQQYNNAMKAIVDQLDEVKEE